MNRNNDRITSDQLFSVLVTLIIGIGILSLPRNLADKAGPDSLIVMVAGAIVFGVIALIILKLITKFPNKTIIEIGSSITSKPIGTIIGFIYLFYLVVLIILEIRAFGEISKNFLLLATPIEVIMITFLLASVYTVRSGIETIARMSVLILPLSIIPAIFTMFFVMGELDPSYFLPFFHTPPLKLIKAIPEVAFSFLGFEFILFLGFFVKDFDKIKRVSMWSLGTVSVIYFITVFITIARFGIAETKSLIWPVVTLFKTVEIPGTIFENVEVVIMSIWLLSIFMTVVITHFGAVFLLSRLLKSREHNYLALPIIPVVYLISLIPENVAQVYDFLGLFSNFFGSISAVIIPSFLLAISYFKRKSKHGRGKNA
ncbi:MAG: spore germination protein [Candidatus Petromonas sp.]|nr:spore germination protein [Candidatus Petromonas sp.]